VSSTYKGFRFPREIISHCVWLYHRFTLSFREIELLMRHCHVVERGKLGECGVSTPLSYKGHRYPVEIINHCVWLYFRFPLSFREVEELMLERGVVVSYETIRRWCAKFGQAYANQLRRRRARPGDKWYLDEVFIRFNGKLSYLWRAVDQHSNVLDVLVQSRRNGNAAKRFFRKLIKGLQYVPRVIVTDKLASYQVAHREMLASVEHRQSKYLNNRAENSHQPTRRREHAMKRFTSARHAQRFLSAFSSISPHFRPGRHRLSAPEWRAEMADRFAVWREVTAADVGV
jgi:putative transposase